MINPYKKAINHAKLCAATGQGVEACGYKNGTWRTVWLAAYEEAKQVDFNFDNFETDVQQAEAKINDRHGIQNEKNAHGHNVDEERLRGDEDGEGEKSGGFDLGLHAGISNADYHATHGISSTQVKYADKALELFHAHQTGAVKFKETPAMRLGTACHKLVLEEMDFDNEIAVSKKFGTSAKGKEEKAEFYAANEGKTIITPEEAEACQGMRDSIMKHDIMGEIFDGGAPELSGFYMDKCREGGNSTFMRMKYRPDWRQDWCLFDLKSTTDASEEAFKRTIHKYGYHISAAHYLEGDRILKGTDHRQFIFGAVESKPPYLSAIYMLDEESLLVGEMLRRKALEGIKHGRSTGEWPGLNQGKPKLISIPSYAIYEANQGNI